MKIPAWPLILTVLVPSHAFAEQPGLENAEVRIPYAELKSLLKDREKPVGKTGPSSALLAARFLLSIDGERPVIDATFRGAGFTDGLEIIPLVGGSVGVESMQPADARVVIQGDMLCMAQEGKGSQALDLKLVPALGAKEFDFVVPACPSSVFETGKLGDNRSVAVKIGGKEEILESNARIPLPLAVGTVGVRLLGGEETREALRSPEPSSWTWQHQALVIPGDGDAKFQLLSRASAGGGSGVSAELTLPADAREVVVTGEDVAGHKLSRAEDRSLGLRIDWKTRGLLEREVGISYVLPRKPLDRVWKLHAPSAPGEGATRTRFSILSSPEFSYAAPGLAGPFSNKTLPAVLAGGFATASSYQVDAASSLDLTLTALPLVAIAEAVVPDAAWSARLEPDGAMLLEGVLNVEHRSVPGLVLQVPSGMVLLACDVAGKAVSPVDLGEGKLEIGLPLIDGKTRVSCSFTGRVPAFDPVEGTLRLELPETPLFIRMLTWRITLPRNYQAEIQGNLTRLPEDPGSPAVALQKNLCRAERPAVNIFYQRAGIASN